MDMVLKPTMSLKKMVTQSKDSGSTGRPSLKAADTCNPHTQHDRRMLSASVCITLGVVVWQGASSNLNSLPNFTSCTKQVSSNVVLQSIPFFWFCFLYVARCKKSICLNRTSRDRPNFEMHLACSAPSETCECVLAFSMS